MADTINKKFGGMTRESIEKSIMADKPLVFSLKCLVDDFFNHPKMHDFFREQENALKIRVIVGNGDVLSSTAVKDNMFKTKKNTLIQSIVNVAYGAFQKDMSEFHARFKSLATSSELTTIAITVTPKAGWDEVAGFVSYFATPSSIFIECMVVKKKYRHKFSLGTFLLCTAEKLFRDVVLDNEVDAVPIYVRTNPNWPSTAFFISLFFKAVANYDTPSFESGMSTFPDQLGTPLPGMSWIVPPHSIFESVPLWVQAFNDDEHLFEEILTRSTALFFGKSPFVSATKDPGCYQVDECIKKSLNWDLAAMSYAISVKTPASEPSECNKISCSDHSDKQAEDSRWSSSADGETIFAGDDIINAVFEIDGVPFVQLMDLGQGESESDCNCLFNCMSFLLMNGEVSHWFRFREYFCFLNRCFSLIPVESILLNFEKLSNEPKLKYIYEWMVMYAYEHVERAYQFPPDRKAAQSYGMPADIKSWPDTTTPELQRNVFRYVSRLFLNSEFEGSVNDLTLLTIPFYCNFCVVEVLLKDSKFDEIDGAMSWIVKGHFVQDPSTQLEKFWFPDGVPNQPKPTFYIARSRAEHFMLLTTSTKSSSDSSAVKEMETSNSVEANNDDAEKNHADILTVSSDAPPFDKIGTNHKICTTSCNASTSVAENVTNGNHIAEDGGADNFKAIATPQPALNEAQQNPYADCVTLPVDASGSADNVCTDSCDTPIAFVENAPNIDNIQVTNANNDLATAPSEAATEVWVNNVVTCNKLPNIENIQVTDANNDMTSSPPEAATEVLVNNVVFTSFDDKMMDNSVANVVVDVDHTKQLTVGVLATGEACVDSESILCTNLTDQIPCRAGKQSCPDNSQVLDTLVANDKQRQIPDIIDPLATLETDIEGRGDPSDPDSITADGDKKPEAKPVVTDHAEPSMDDSTVSEEMSDGEANAADTVVVAEPVSEMVDMWGRPIDDRLKRAIESRRRKEGASTATKHPAKQPLKKKTVSKPKKSNHCSHAKVTNHSHEDSQDLVPLNGHDVVFERNPKAPARRNDDIGFGKVAILQVKYSGIGFNELQNNKKRTYLATEPDHVIIPGILKPFRRCDRKSILLEDVKDAKSFLQNKLSDLSKAERKLPYKEVLYDKSQLCEKNARRAASFAYKKNLLEAKSELREAVKKVHEYQAYLISQNKDPEMIPRKIMDEYYNKKAKVHLINDAMSKIPMFHPTDSILAVRKDGDNRYYGLCKQQDGRLLEKEFDFLEYETLFEPEFREAVNEHTKKSGWLHFPYDSTETVARKKSDVIELANELRPIYFHRPSPDQDKIMWIKAVASFEIGETDTPFFHHINWKILCRLESNEKYEYKSITEKYLEECAQGSLVYSWKVDFTTIFNAERLSGVINEKHLLDPNDPDRPPAETKYGLLEHEYSFYINTSHMSLYSGNTTGCISAVRYEAKKKTYVGMIKYPDGTNECEDLTEDWVKENFDEVFMTALTSASQGGKTRFINVPPGDVRVIRPAFVEPSNPPIHFPQGQCNSCAFSSMASVMHYLGFHEDAKLLDSYRIEFYESPYYLERIETVLKHLVFSVQHNCKQFVADRMQKSVNRHFDLLHHIFLPSEIALITLWGENGDHSHTVVICDNLIFDSNASNAMDFTQAALDECCGCRFVAVWKGYYFHQRKEAPKNWLTLIP